MTHNSDFNTVVCTVPMSLPGLKAIAYGDINIIIVNKLTKK